MDAVQEMLRQYRSYADPMTNASGNFQWLKGDNLQDIVDNFIVQHKNGWNESTTTNDKIAAELKEDKGNGTLWYVGAITDQGNLPSTAYPTPVAPSDTRTYVPPGQPPANQDWLTSIIAFFRSLVIK